MAVIEKKGRLIVGGVDTHKIRSGRAIVRRIRLIDFRRSRPDTRSTQTGYLAGRFQLSISAMSFNWKNDIGLPRSSSILTPGRRSFM
jgi:hypothetical protein